MLAVLFLGAAFAAVQSGEPAKKDGPKRDARPTLVPYRLTDTHHVLVRLKVNGKGPFNFVVDTGCPVLVISEPAAKKMGLEADSTKAAVIDKLELEGGLVQNKVKCRVETPFQIEGMNSMGLPGVELHGLIGYTVLAKYKMEFDFTKDQMQWLALDFDPPPPQAIGGKKGDLASLEAMAGMMKFLSFLTGLKPAPPPQPRGFFGFEVAEKDGAVVVQKVLAKGPAAEAGLKSGDRIAKAEGKEVGTVAELMKQASQITAGKELRLDVTRGTEKHELKITAGDGF